MPETRVITFGCRLNAFESELIERAVTAAGLRDAVIVNTCAVTAEAERQARQAIRRAHRNDPEAIIFVTGCAAEIAPERYAALPEVDRVLGNREKLLPQTYLPADTPSLPSPASGGAPGQPPARAGVPGVEWGSEGRSPAYLQVQQGCDHRCTFCVIPYGRGPSRSVPIEAIADQARRLAAAGCPEIVLTGVDLTAYGVDLPGRPTLGEMVGCLLAEIPEIGRLRLSSLDPAEIDADFWRLLGVERRLMPHLHLSLQSGDDLILKRMKRRHSRADAIAVARRARDLRPEMALGADLIAGFPTETEDAFCRMRARFCARLSLQRAARHARRPYAAAASSDRQGASGASASGGGSGTRGRAFIAGWKRDRGPDRATRNRPGRVLRCRGLHSA